LQSRSFSNKPINAGEEWQDHGYNPEMRASVRNPRQTLAAKFQTLPGPHDIPMTLTGWDASAVLPTGPSPNHVVILDPPYVGTTGYSGDSTRSVVVAIARAWADEGALVLIHEAEPVEIPGFTSRPAGVLRGQKSGFWKGGVEREWITSSRPPEWWPTVQGSLF